MIKAFKLGLAGAVGLAILSLILWAMANNLATGQSNASPPAILSTTTLKIGSGAGNYTTASTTLVPVDSTNQCLTVTIPVGFKLIVSASGSADTATAAAVATLALTDNASCATANAGVLQTVQVDTGVASNAGAYSLVWVINGDGNAHNVALQYDTSAAADVATVLNSAATLAPTMVFQLVKSN